MTDELAGLAAGGAMREERKVWKVSELTRRVKGLLDDQIGHVWVEGEISNFRRAPSGHAYFTLKDAAGQMRAVMFRGALAGVLVEMRDGLLVQGFGQVTVYEAGGDLQIVLKRLEAAGEGELMRQLELRKKKLAAEGLFDEERKRKLPVLARHIGVVTSPTGAAIRDILNVLNRRFANLHVVLAPARVQGEGAAEEIAAAIDLLNGRGGLDVLIVGRGGGSIEDLWAFNEEVVVRAVARSAIPVISAVGHEIDWTLSDFAADVRAATPSAAAELVVESKEGLERRVGEARRRLVLAARALAAGWRSRFEHAARTPALRDPLQMLAALQQRVDLLAMCVQRRLTGLPQLVRQRTDAAARSMAAALQGSLVLSRQRVERQAQRLILAAPGRLNEWRARVKNAEARLRVLNPKNVLARGYSMTRLQDGTVVISATAARPGAKLITELADGRVLSTVDEDIKKGDPHERGKEGKGPELRESTRTARRDRGRDGGGQSGAGKNGGGLRGGPEAGQALLF